MMPHPLANRFQRFAETECRNSSDLYYHLSVEIAADGELLELAARARPGQPVPNLFFGAVHYLLLSGNPHPLSAHYPSISTEPRGLAHSFPMFREFCLSHREEIGDLLESRLVQTNEIRRSAYLFPAFLHVAAMSGNRPVALVEIGTSAGLNLIPDRLSYSYGTSECYGDLTSAVHVMSSFRGPRLPILTGPAPIFSHRIGLDLNIVDVSDPDEVRWLQALIWPEHHERRTMLDGAICLLRTETLDLREGDGVEMLGAVIRGIPEDSVVCFFHTHVANQLSDAARSKLLTTIADVGGSRDVVHLCNNIRPNLHLSSYLGGVCVEQPLANTDGHARWIEWLATDPCMSKDQ